MLFYPTIGPETAAIGSQAEPRFARAALGRGALYPRRTTGEVMTDPKTSRHVEIKDDDDRTAAVAEVTTASGPEGTVRTSMYGKNEHVRRGDRAALVDEVMDLPEVKASERVEATVPCGDAELVERLRERTDDAVLRAAGGTTLLDANVPPDGDQSPASDQRPADADGPPGSAC
jgi:hypothetical protein